MSVRSFNDAPTSSPPPIEVRPSPSHVDAHGPSPVLTFTPSPSPDVASMPIDEDVPNLAMEDPFLTSMIVLWLHLSMERFVNLRLRQRLSHCPLGNNLITHGLHEEQFQKIIKNFFPRIFRMSEMKIKGHIGLEILSRTICYHIGMHLGGSISLEYHTIRFSETLGRLAYTYELFQQTHLRKDTDQFVDDRSRQAYVKPLSCMSLYLGSFGILITKRKGCLYGTGDLAHSYKCGDDNFMQRTQGSSSHAQDSAEINRLREKLHQSKEEMHVFISVSRPSVPTS
ncbi:hypothetical protein HKD37_06G016248 [Glycine soja]